jgi:hypothetical protein
MRRTAKNEMLFVDDKPMPNLFFGSRGSGVRITSPRPPSTQNNHYKVPEFKGFLAAVFAGCILTRQNRQFLPLLFLRDFVRANLTCTGQITGQNYSDTWKGGVSKDHVRYTKRYKARYPERALAHRAVRWGIRNGELVRGACQNCGTTEDVHGHHPFYEHPLLVEWLCRGCHMTHHTKTRKRSRKHQAGVCDVDLLGVLICMALILTSLVVFRM